MTRFISLMAMLGTMPALAAWGSTGGDDMVAVAAGGPVDSLDKSGTSGVRQKSGALQAIEWSALAKRRSFAAERGGFEPPVRFDPHTAFPVPHNRPLCHLSKLEDLAAPAA
jgi:hypothetical protein